MQRTVRSRRPQRLLSLLVGLLMIGCLVGGCGSSSTTASSGGSAATSATTAGGATTAGAGVTPGSCPTSNTTPFAKTKFVAHAALAFGVFHRYLYKPYEAGTFKHFHSGRIVALVKAAAAAVFIEHEVRLSAEDVQANPTLCRDIAAPLRRFYSAISGLGSSIKSGGTTGITQAQGNVSSVISAAGGHGVSITPDDNASI